MDLVEQVGWRMRRHGLRGRTLQLKVRFADFSTITRSHSLPEPTDVTDELRQTADDLLCGRLPPRHLPVRLLGVGVGGLDGSGQVQGMLFDAEEQLRRCKVDDVRDRISERFGTSALRRGSSPDLARPARAE